ncbi:MAG: hypothetical protein ABSF62_02455 [Bryobacteraceae bacterium]|jgi:hypothetical protein
MERYRDLMCALKILENAQRAISREDAWTVVQHAKYYLLEEAAMVLRSLRSTR